jgi:hypothetical protein
MTSFSRTRSKTSAIENVAKVIESEVIVRFAAENLRGQLFCFAHARGILTAQCWR